MDITRTAYNEIADRWTDGRFPNPDNGVPQHERALAFLTEPVDGFALNVGCGCSTRLNGPMRRRGLTLEGVDFSERMLDLARIGDPAIVLHRADICEWELPRAYDFISAWDSIWHVPLAAQRPMMLKLMLSLTPGGVFIFSAGGLDAPAEHVDSNMGPEVYYSTLGIPGILNVVAESDCICRHLEFDQYPEKHLYLIVQRVA